MSEQRQRLTLWMGLAILTLLLFIPKGHDALPGGAPAVAFLHGGQGKPLLRLRGDVPTPGIYQSDTPVSAATFLRQKAPGVAARAEGDYTLPTLLSDGDVLTVQAGPGKTVTLTRSGMTARERMALGIPLDPARMTAADWEALPGIGPALTERIMAASARRGGLNRLDDLLTIDGVGEGTIAKLRPLFAGPRKDLP